MCHGIPAMCKIFLCQPKASHARGDLSFPKSLLKRCYFHSSVNVALTAMGDPWLSQEEIRQFNDLLGKLGLFIKSYLFQL